MITTHKVIAAVWAHAQNEQIAISENQLASIIGVTIGALGLAIAANGEVYNPAPAPSRIPQQQNVHYLGNGRRRSRVRRGGFPR